MERGLVGGYDSVETVDSMLISENDPQAVAVVNKTGKSRIILTCEHAGNCIPERLGTLGLKVSDLSRHIAWDIGAAATARHIAKQIDAPLVLQTYSRLVVDCNRPESSSEAIPLTSDGIKIAGNENLSVDDRKKRFSEIVHPFHKAVKGLLDERVDRGVAPLIFTIHSFTSRLMTEQTARPWDLGLLYNRDNRLAVLFREVLDNTDHDLLVADNEPYVVSDECDYTLPMHSEKRDIPGLLLEIRNDHVADKEGVSQWGEFLSGILKEIIKHSS